MMNHSIDLLHHQGMFVQDCDTPYILLLGGFGSGKTRGFCAKAVYMGYLNLGGVGAIMEPTGPLIRDILVPAMDEFLDDARIPYKFQANNGNPNYTLKFRNGTATIWCRSAENWRRHIGSNLSFVGVDEIDTIKPDEALAMIRKVNARIRKGNKLQFFCASTPEGFRFCYNFFEKANDKDRRTIRARTRDNPYLPDGYIEKLRKLYPPNLIEAYLKGLYVNLTSGQVYPSFSRATHDTAVTENGQEPLHIGMDFNVTKMSAVVHVTRRCEQTANELAFAVDEFSRLYDTPAMIESIRNRYPRRTIIVYPDASGQQRHTGGASQTDLSLLRQAGFSVVVDGSNPAIKDRVLSMNTAFKDGDGFIRYRVNVIKCPNYTECLEQQVYTQDGLPDKSNDRDHPNDAAGYFIHQKFPAGRSGLTTVRFKL